MLADMLDVELRRKGAHLVLGLALIALILTGHAWTLLLLFPLALVLASKTLRKRWKRFDHYMSAFDRKDARAAVGGAWFVAGVLLVWLVFRRADITCAATAILTLGDTVAALAGLQFGQTPNPLNSKVSLEGSLAGLVAAALGAVVFVDALPAIVGATAAMLIEAVEVKVSGQTVDDNFLIPAVAALAMYPLL